MAKGIFTDIVLWIIASVICILWRLMAHKGMILAYVPAFVVMMILWLILAWIFRKYRSYKAIWYWQELLSMLLTSTCLVVIIYCCFAFCGWFAEPIGQMMGLSATVLFFVLGIVVIFDLLIIIAKHYRKYALNMTVPPLVITQREGEQPVLADELRTPSSQSDVRQAVLSLTANEDLQLLLERAHLYSRLTKVVASSDPFSIIQLSQYRYRTIVDLTLLNHAKGINRRFCYVNDKLPDDGIYVCCYRPMEYVKSKILTSYPWGINYLVYTVWFIFRRIVPRMLLLSRLHYDLTRGRKRVLSKTEVLGRLYYCGFEVDDVVPSGHIEYVFAHRHSQPYPQDENKVYGPLIRLPRVCKNKEIKYFYKLRTMHPYSEYIQKYVFDSRGGMNIADKADDDWRITHWGRLLRRYWLDELPMLFNWLRGDVKLVGVRPLSQTMFNEYPEDLQDLRTRCKPGLIPPFYIDHPKTFDELYESERRYLEAYFQHPFMTDVRYFFLTIHSILFRRMHSA